MSVGRVGWSGCGWGCVLRGYEPEKSDHELSASTPTQPEGADLFTQEPPAMFTASTHFCFTKSELGLFCFT